ncbi:MAG: helix-turn-helix transcriptional regulator [Bacteroidia bacterium]|nr:helix-turn-helix transcriptional regulator [Bacteroidia bacterium]
MAKSEKDTYLYAFGKHLAEIRRNKKFSQEKLAFAADIDLGTLSKLERGLLNLSIYNAYKLSKALSIKHSELFEFEFPTLKKSK